MIGRWASHGGHLEHDLDLRLGRRAERQPAKPFHRHVMAHPQAEHVPVEAQRLILVMDQDEGV
jgi:hypothetical protein